ncbi:MULTISPECIES: UDP-N-acetylglucosamine--undecaprenyl-phosphate N-acetylglucosaminephosphotransferase [Marinobacter]|uniref:Undecaprenyl-phosphate alpha-N-acetylglucosaminyl 1-phosphate transferase n=1 Tax=Marinobacter excellens LAMA 842 TaxID=1306954 RepID=A0A137S1V8_9GAMM|nr:MULTISPECIES: UDP-N-acetylglucosamine--undecaprenyl-phosphate N-acetylglucosaminephosphotransferase [Marinobacter]KXO06417.1 Undecaprenyl-phosphate N-acetylglucosaminyl 1-phosphate transferase [Marinobacter excellens LAMA 842]
MGIHMEAASSTGLMAGLFALISLWFLRPVAYWVQLLDAPDHRKHHKGVVPLIGGLSAFIGLCVAWLIGMPLVSEHGLFLLCATVLVVVGAVDDARDLPAKFRLAVQVGLGALLVYGSGVSLTAFGDLFNLGVIDLGFLGPLVTIAAVIGATNAFNMVDGIDGLAGSLSLVTLLSLIVLFAFAPEAGPALALAVGIACALLPYLMANLRIPPFRYRVFMGDAGSMFIGFSVVWLLVNATQPEQAGMRPVTALWIIAIPLIDMVAIMVRRARKGQSLMKPDREHLHHIFMRAGFSDREALLMITLIALVCAGIGLAGEFFNVPEWVMFTTFLGVFALYDWSLSHVWRLLVLFRKKVTHQH